MAAICLACLLAPFDAAAARRALVVGNDTYQNVSKLRNARNDAQAVSRELEAAGFAVTRLLDADRETMNNTIDGFLRRLEKGDEVVFYFSGHGSQPPQLGPYLLPVDIKVSSERSIQRDGLSIEQLVEDLNRRARFSLLIIDACRDDPFRQTSAGRSLPPGSGLSRIEPPKGTMIIMAASKGQQALDRLSNSDPVPNGLFTRELIRHMKIRGLSAADVLKRVRTGVETAAANVNHQQRPALIDEASTDFYFYPPGGDAQTAAATAAPALIPVSAPPAASTVAPAKPPVATQVAIPSPAATSAQSDLDAYEAALAKGTRAAMEAYLSQFPGGRYNAAAKARLARLQATAPPAPPATAPAASTNPLQAEFEVWDRAATSKRKDDYQRYLGLYPNGRYADLARAALKNIQ